MINMVKYQATNRNSSFFNKEQLPFLLSTPCLLNILLLANSILKINYFI